MRAIIGAGVLSLAVATSALAAKGNRGSERRQVGEFDAIAVHAGIHLAVAIGERSVEVTADAETMQRVVTEVKDGVLEIGFERKAWGLFQGFHDEDVEVRVRTPRLASVEASGGAEAEVTATTADKVHLGASGGGSVTAGKVAAREVDLSASGGATVAASGLDARDLIAGGSGGAVLRLAGRATHADVSFSGGTVVKGSELEVQRASVHGSGGGSARMKIADQVEGRLSGGATLHTSGNPQGKVRTSGGGEVVYEDGRGQEKRDAEGWGARGRDKHDGEGRHGKHHDEDEDD